MSAFTGRWGPSLPLAAGALVACLTLLPSSARAAGCCGSQLAQADRLSPDEWRSISLSTSFAPVTGGFDATGSFRTLSAGQWEGELRAGLSLAHRLTDTLQAGLSAGWLETFRTTSSASGQAGGLDDTVVSARWDPDALDEWALTAAVLLPTGRGGAESVDPLGADVTGRGAWGLRVGFAWERGFGPNFLLVNAALTGHGPARSSDVRASLLPQVGASVGRTFASGAGVAGSFEMSSQVGMWGAEGRVPGSSWYLATLRAVGTWPVGSASVTGQVWLQPPVAWAGLNESSRVGLGVGLRRAW